MSIAVELVDARRVPAPQCQALIFGAFDALDCGEGFDVLDDHEPAALYQEFGRRHGGEFRWCCVERGPRRWRVRIERLGRGEPPPAAAAAGADREPCACCRQRG
ncbi:MAG: DUF2249 domain-containing protein [Rubrivivax sp.]|nr:DUF2249 domain-containing protein [Rubrivivax sp.]